MQSLFMKRSRPAAEEADDGVAGAWPVRGPAAGAGAASSECIHIVPRLLNDMSPVPPPPRTPPPQTLRPRGSVAGEAGWNPLLYSEGGALCAGPLPPPPPRIPPATWSAQPPPLALDSSPYSEGVAIADQPFEGSHAVAVLHAAPWAWTTTILHVGGRTKWDDVKRRVVERNNAWPGGPSKRVRVEHYAYRLVTQTSGRWLEWNKAARPTTDSLMTLELNVDAGSSNAGVWGPPGEVPRRVIGPQYSEISTIVLVPSERFRHQ